ncbi:MAG: zinc-binding dehydrogenase [Solirubrobacterales bacterium]|nr:zinc-binding dehydrogenase [Solirubrobacterales bacterium]
MRAVVMRAPGPPENLVVEDRPDPDVGPGEIRIAVKAAGINFAELLARTGVYPDAPKPPCVLGYEVAGEVESLGEGVEGFSAGDPVFAPTMFGGQAELVTVPAGDVYMKPERLSFEKAAALPVNYCTALAALVEMGGLHEGQRVLIHAAAGGVGTASIQIATEIGAEIYGTASPGKHDVLREMGVHHPIDYRNDDFEKAINEITSGEGVDLIIDATGPTNFRKDYRILRQGGKLIMFGLSEVQGAKGIFDPRTLSALVRMPLSASPWWKSLGVMNENKGVFGLNLLDWWKKEGLTRLGAMLEDRLEAGQFDPVISKTFTFEEAPEAHRFIESRQNIGKVLLVP